MPQCVGIIGLGLIGGSLARALKHLDVPPRILAVEPQSAVRTEALRARAVDAAREVAMQELECCDLVVIASPIDTVSGIMDALRPHLAPAVLVSDVCGVKQAVEDLAREHLPSCDFVGAHPMAGGVEGGFGHSRSDLFTGAPVALCPGPGSESRVPELADFWRTVGARPSVMTAEAHDRLVALSSHLPYLTAVALVELLVERPEAAALSGNGLRYATRQASFAPEVMAASALRNPHVIDDLRRLSARLEHMARRLESSPDEVREVVAQARRNHQRLLLER